MRARSLTFPKENKNERYPSGPHRLRDTTPERQKERRVRLSRSAPPLPRYHHDLPALRGAERLFLRWQPSTTLGPAVRRTAVRNLVRAARLKKSSCASRATRPEKSSIATTLWAKRDLKDAARKLHSYVESEFGQSGRFWGWWGVAENEL